MTCSAFLFYWPPRLCDRRIPLRLHSFQNRISKRHQQTHRSTFRKIPETMSASSGKIERVDPPRSQKSRLTAMRFCGCNSTNISAVGLLLLLLASSVSVVAFVAPLLHRRNVQSSPLYNDINPSLEGGEGSFDVDSARKQLQSLFHSGGDETTGDSTSSSSSGTKASGKGDFSIRKFLKEAANDWRKQQETVKTGTPVPLDDSVLPPLPPLSTIERDRRQAEIHLLGQLQNASTGEDAIKGLWELWYSERGGLALARLQQADQLMGDPTSWQDCETSLLQLIDEYGIYFVEPLNRLATLYYLQGKYEDSYQLCRLILLKLKPWHVGALAGIVQVCINRGDRDEARYWAAKRLPSSVAGSSFPPFLDASNGPENPRRAEWVNEMVQNAKKMLKQAERTTKKQFGEPERYYEKGMPSETDWENGFGNQAWQ